MAIWLRKIDISILNARSENTLGGLLGIEFIDFGDDFIRAKMPIDDRHKQPLGIMHGGASCVLAESVGSTAANFCVTDDHYCVGLDINTNHIKSVREGFVIATTFPYHLGKSTQVWSIEIRNEEGKMISINRLTMAVLKRELK